MRGGAAGMLAALIMTVAGCGLPHASPATPRSQLDAVIAQLRSATSLHLTGNYGNSPDTFQLDLELSGGAVVGTMRRNQSPPLQILGHGQRVYLRGADYFAATQTVAIGDRWVEDAGIEHLVASMDTPAQLATEIAGLTRSFKVRAGAVMMAGHRMTTLTANGVTVWVAGSPAQVARVTSQPAAAVAPTSPFDLRLDRYGAAVAVPALPTQVLDLSLRQNWLPGYYSVKDSPPTLTNCDPAGCTISATVANAGGLLGKVNAILTVSLDQVTPLASCQVPLDPTPDGQQTTVSCRANFRGMPGQPLWLSVDFKIY
ncbi:MAG: hypothetical protein J2P29_16335 [Actinobacteria bacterium]|nr:hypothetical protein [Actinomycetota bacterium]